MTRRVAVPLALLGASLGLLLALALAGSSGPGTDTLDASSRSAGSGGTLALYEWLDGLGLGVHRVSGDFDLGGSDVLVVAQPEQSFTTDQVDEVMSFLRQGGELILALDGASAVDAAGPLLERLGQPVTASAPSGVAVPLQPLEPGGAVRRVSLQGSAHPLDLAAGEGAPLLGIDDRVVMRGLAVGSGRAYVLGSVQPLTNVGLRSTTVDPSGARVSSGSDSAALVLAMLEHTTPLGDPPLRIGFDEVHHGEGASGGARAILVTPLGLAALLAALCIVGYLAGAGRRLGRPIPAGDPARVPSATAYVGAMAGLFARARDRGAVADRYARELKDRVGAATGVDPALDDAPFCAALAGYGEPRQGEVAAALARARGLSAARPDGAALLDLARTVDAVEARWAAGAAS